MPRRYRITNAREVHFLTFTVVDWVDAFTRKEYRDIFLNSIKYCQEQKGLVVHGWCVMTNHVHLLLSATDQNLSAIIRDLKKFASRVILKGIIENNHESRKEWMLRVFKEAGAKNARNKHYQFWRQDNHPKECYSPEFTVQKPNYIHKNPVEAGIVNKPEEYLYSSARDYHEGTNCGLLKIVFL